MQRFFLPSDPAPPRIILEPPSSDGTYTIVAGSSFVLSCEVGIYSYPHITMPISVFRVVGNMTVPLTSEFNSTVELFEYNYTLPTIDFTQ